MVYFLLGIIMICTPKSANSTKRIWNRTIQTFWIYTSVYTQLFDKRDHFGFNITRLPFKDSNIPCNMFYSSIAAECLRICRATSSKVHATASIKIVVARMIKQGADPSKMESCISKMFNRHDINRKFGVNDNSFVGQLFRWTCVTILF